MINMIKVMVVDDELMIRRGLRCAIDWPVWGLHFCGDAGSGAEALELARRHHPEIVITDIRMPLMNGLELAHQLREMLPDVKIVFLTGYEDISYLKKAMEMGIKDYLLKPAGMSEIIPVVARLRDEIKQDHDRKNHLESRDSLLEDSLPVLQSHLIDSLLTGRQNLQSAITRAVELHINLDGPQYRIILAEIRSSNYNNRDPQPSMSIWLLIRIMQEVLESADVKTFACRLPSEEIMILLNEPMGYNLNRDHLERITRLAYSQLGLEIALFASGTVDGLEQLPIVSKQCQRCQAHQPWAEHNRIFIWEEIQSLFSGVTPDTRAYENQIFASINDNSQLNLSLIRKIFDAFQENGASFTELKRRCVRILTVAKFLENGHQLDFDPEDRINSVRTASKLYSEMESVLQSLNLSVEKAAVPSIQDRVLAYVHDHYHENINLEQLATKLFLSSSYLGRVLRTDLGMPFHEWLNRYRVNRACELLKNRNLKTSEIALMVGFSSYKYFSQIFAQHIGYSTREYRNRLIGSGE